MSIRIRTNIVDYSLDKNAFSEKYDLFCLETSDKYIKQGSYILDAESLCNDIKAIKFESGRKLHLLMHKNDDNKQKLQQMLKNIEGGTAFAIKQIVANDVNDYILLQLMLNSISSYDSKYLKYNNLTGHLYCFHPNWIKRGKEKGQDIIWKIPSLEVVITQDYKLKLLVRTFTSVLLRNKMTFKRKKFEEYPKYVFAANNTLRRKLRDDDEQGFILRQVDGVKTEIPFLDLQNIEKFNQSKNGVLNQVLKEFNSKFIGICNIGFKEKEIVNRIDYSKAVQRENIKRITEILDSTGVHLVDKVDDAYSSVFCANISNLLKTKYGIEATSGKRVSKDKLNIIIIHNAEYYNGINDPHDKDYGNVAVQHITFEDFSDSSEFALATVIQNVIVKQDLIDGKISLYDWGKLGIDEDISFGIEDEIDEVKRYFFIKICKNGEFKCFEQELTLFDINEYTELVEIFEQARTNSEIIKGVIRYSNGDISVIKETGIFTLPKFEKLEELLVSGDNRLRGKERREELLASCLDIKTFNEDGEQYYFAGQIGEGMRQNIQRASLVRLIESNTHEKNGLGYLLPLMNVVFVRNGQLTVMPFPFKYLREYVEHVKGAEND